MHRPRSPRIASALKAGAWLMIFTGLILFLSVSTLIYSMLTETRSLFLPALLGIILGIIFLTVFRMVSTTARCSLCASPVMLSSRAQRNRNAKPLLGSYRFRVAKDIALSGSYRCPFCGEDTLCIPKEQIRQF